MQDPDIVVECHLHLTLHYLWAQVGTVWTDVDPPIQVGKKVAEIYFLVSEA